jgi:hypothetical protein
MVFVAASTGVLVWLIMHLHLQLAVLRERENNWQASLPAPVPATQPVITEEWIEARVASLLFRLAEQRFAALPAPAENDVPFPSQTAAIEVEATSKPTHRRRAKAAKPAPKRPKRAAAKAH